MLRIGCFLSRRKLRLHEILSGFDTAYYERRMTSKDLPNILQQGENSSVEFKESAVRPESLAREIVSFVNSAGA